MPRKTKTIIQETEVVPTHDSPDVLAYRVGQLEKTTANGLKEVKEELVNLKNHFVTHADLDAAKQQSDLEHQNIKDDIKELQDWNKWAIRIVLGIVITAVVGMVIVTKIQ